MSQKNSDDAGMLEIFLFFGFYSYFFKFFLFWTFDKKWFEKKDQGNADEFLQNYVYVGLECLKSIWCNAETDVWFRVKHHFC